MADSFQQVEQDRSSLDGGNELPTYDDLAQQLGPNSRHGHTFAYISEPCRDADSRCFLQIWEVEELDREKVCR
jgi:hypothetical protein